MQQSGTLLRARAVNSFGTENDQILLRQYKIMSIIYKWLNNKKSIVGKA